MARTWRWQCHHQVVAGATSRSFGTMSRADRLRHLQTAFFASGNDPSVWLDGWWPEVAVAQSAAVRATDTEDLDFHLSAHFIWVA